MSQAPKVSVLLPVHNAGAFIDAALASLAAQTLPDFEIVAVDDGSTDASEQRLEACARRMGRLRIFRQARGGVAAALNAGFAQCRGELVARMDADDIAAPDRLARQMRFLADHPDVGVCGTGANEFGDGPEREIRPPGDDDAIRAWLLFGSPFVHPTVMFRRALCVADSGPYSLVPGVEDYDLWTRLAKRTRFANLPATLLSYRRHGAQYTASKAEGHAAALAAVHQRVLAAAGVAPGDPVERAAHAATAFDRTPGAPRPQPAAVAAWLSRLLSTAPASGWCGADSLRDLCGERWWAFMRGGRRGPAAACAYLRGPIAGSGLKVWWRALRLTGFTGEKKC